MILDDLWFIQKCMQRLLSKICHLNHVESAVCSSQPAHNHNSTFALNDNTGNCSTEEGVMLGIIPHIRGHVGNYSTHEG